MMLITFLASIKIPFYSSLSLPDRDDLIGSPPQGVKELSVEWTLVSDDRFIMQTLTIVQFEKLITEL